MCGAMRPGAVVSASDSPLMTAAREAARAIEAMCAAQDDVRREPMVAAKRDVAEDARVHCWHRIEVLRFSVRPSLRHDEIEAMRRAVNCGIVAPAWALRVVAIAAEVEGHAAGAAEIEGRYKPHGYASSWVLPDHGSAPADVG